jgi:transcriptional regulator with XRE-family HTH domain
MPSVTPYGEKIQSLRKALGLTQLQLALRAGVSERTVRNAERGRPLKRDFLQFIAVALEIDVRELARIPAELSGFFDWQRNVTVVNELLHRACFTYDITGLTDVVHPRFDAKYNIEGMNMGGLAERYIQARTGVDEAKRMIDWMGDFSTRIVERTTTFQPPAGDGKLVVLRGTDHIKYSNGFDEHAWYLHVIEFDGERMRKWEQYNGFVDPLQNAALTV